MAGPIQIGDIIKFSEIAMEVWRYGWEPEHNAGENYRAFGVEVRTLRDSLKRLDSAVLRTQQSLRRYGAREIDCLGADRSSLYEIIGDYDATLEECRLLLQRNLRYSQTTSPMRNIEWNYNVMPQVDHLRGRIRMHSSRIQHVLKPFEIVNRLISCSDLISNIHGDLVRRLTGIHQDVLGIRRDINAIIQAYYPQVAQDIEQQMAQEIHSLRIPDHLLARLNVTFEASRSRASPEPIPLRDLADCFLIHMQDSTENFYPESTNHDSTPSVMQYLELVKSQYLMQQIRASHELDNLPRTSHWRGYIASLQEKLSQQCARFETELLAPSISHVADEVLLFRLGNDDDVLLQQNRSPPPIEPRFNFLMEAHRSLEAEPGAWRMIQLRRRIGSDTQFRILEMFGDHDRSSITDSRIIDFNIHGARLIPIYADPIPFPTPDAISLPAQEIVLEENNTSHSYVFLNRSELLQFQEALTGFKVVDEYTQYVPRPRINLPPST
ncbi:hypothetical protein LLEC1_07097 [Akanthomyces lecanii]|uniref:Fungal N-terminal domain-containing protein n=1 Tax=Cordyceps confragosa TaxID=2714763 RepID=A0A179IL94_CORDF|nr:hypothetical protein LLEC1_07097 [Akanthomyces lecanii]